MAEARRGTVGDVQDTSSIKLRRGVKCGEWSIIPVCQMKLAVQALVPRPLPLGIHAQTWTAINWMQYFASHVATMALLLSQNGLRNDLRASNF